jgi:hypothetical protein
VGAMHHSVALLYHSCIRHWTQSEVPPALTCPSSYPRQAFAGGCACLHVPSMTAPFCAMLPVLA